MYLIKQNMQIQQKRIISDIQLLFVTICALNRWTLEDILYYYNITKAECIQKLLVLHKLHIIELLLNNKIKLLIASDFSWIPNGPIQRFFQENLERDFFKSPFVKPTELYICLNGMLSDESNAILQKKIKQLTDSFSDLTQKPVKTSMSKLKNSTIVIGLRPWTPKIFERFKKPTVIDNPTT